MCSCFLECNCRLNIVLVLSIGVKDITLHLGIAVCATTVGVDSLNICWTIVECLASLPWLVALYYLTTSVETFLEVSHIDDTWNRYIESSETICAHKQILRRICVYSYSKCKKRMILTRTRRQREIFHAFTARGLTGVEPASTSHVAHIWRITQFTRLYS